MHNTPHSVYMQKIIRHIYRYIAGERSTKYRNNNEVFDPRKHVKLAAVTRIRGIDIYKDQRQLLLTKLTCYLHIHKAFQCLRRSEVQLLHRIKSPTPLPS